MSRSRSISATVSKGRQDQLASGRRKIEAAELEYMDSAAHLDQPANGTLDVPGTS